jgi:hypothetical protein
MSSAPRYTSAPSTPERSTYGGSFSLNPSTPLTFYNASKPSEWEPIEPDAEGYIEPIYVTACEIRVKILLRIVHSDEAIHHEIHMEWSGRGSASTISDRRVEIVVDINQVGDGKYDNNHQGKAGHRFLWRATKSGERRGQDSSFSERRSL